MSVQRLRAANPDLELTEIDMHHIIEKLVKNARQYDFLETRFPCLGGPLMKAGQGSWNPIELMASISNGTCLNPDRYFFWDPWHPSTKVHCLAAANVLDQMDQAHLLQGLGDKIQLESMEKSCLKG
jgi:phospholipase/lecithinase/hemolysin